MFYKNACSKNVITVPLWYWQGHLLPKRIKIEQLLFTSGIIITNPSNLKSALEFFLLICPEHKKYNFKIYELPLQCS